MIYKETPTSNAGGKPSTWCPPDGGHPGIAAVRCGKGGEKRAICDDLGSILFQRTRGTEAILDRNTTVLDDLGTSFLQEPAWQLAKWQGDRWHIAKVAGGKVAGGR